MLIIRVFKLPHVAFHVFVLSVGSFLYVLNNYLIAKHIKKKAPSYLSFQEVLPNVQKWELTAGRGIVPKWVSLIGLLAFGFILACPFEVFALLLRKHFNFDS